MHDRLIEASKALRYMTKVGDRKASKPFKLVKVSKRQHYPQHNPVKVLQPDKS